MKNELTFRRATAADFEAVLELASQLANHIEEATPPLTLAKFETHYVRPHAPMHLLLAVHGEKVVGMIAWTLTYELYSAHSRVYISDVSVDHVARGKGVGAALMAQVIAWARSNNAAKLGWEVWYRNFGARTFYEKLGASIHQEAIPYLLELKDELS